jgi:hypothetical protein
VFLCSPGNNLLIGALADGVLYIVALPSLGGVWVRVARWYIFIPKNPNLGKFWRALECKRMVYSLAIWNILPPFM